MQVLSIDRLDGPGNVLAHACVQVTPDVRVNGIRLVRTGNGDMRIYSPNSCGASVLSFSPAAIAELKVLIIEAYRSATAHDHQHAA